MDEVEEDKAWYVVVKHDEFLTFTYYNCESKIFKQLSVVPLTPTAAAWARGSRTPPRLYRPPPAPFLILMLLLIFFLIL
ncbi:unnamed protein product, partial [Brenthis ino]